MYLYLLILNLFVLFIWISVFFFKDKYIKIKNELKSNICYMITRKFNKSNIIENQNA